MTAEQTFLELMHKVLNFHSVFGLEYFESPQAQLSEKVIALRHRLMQEELSVYWVTLP